LKDKKPSYHGELIMRADNAVVTAIIKTDEEFLREVADRLRARMARTAQDIVEIGLDLIEVRARVGDGKFSAWIEAEFTMSRVTAYMGSSVFSPATIG
jgi:hypothetical protein